MQIENQQLPIQFKLSGFVNLLQSVLLLFCASHHNVRYGRIILLSHFIKLCYAKFFGFFVCDSNLFSGIVFCVGSCARNVCGEYMKAPKVFRKHCECVREQLLMG